MGSESQSGVLDRFRGHPSPLPSEARCTSHPDALAEAHCARCGDFVCRLCGPLEPVPLCTRCALKTTLDWEERGDHGARRAYYLTLRDAIGSPTRLGQRLGGSGHIGSALSFVTITALLGLVPLALLMSVPLLSVADPMRLGLRSTGVFSMAIFLVLFSVALATLLGLWVLGFSLCVWLTARLFAIPVRYDVLVRASGYGLSLLALPVLGPLLVPFSLGQTLLACHAVLFARRADERALLALVTVGLVAAGAIWSLRAWLA
jgi:hypothetical protein